MQLTSEQKFVNDSILIFALNRLRVYRNEDIELDADIDIAVRIGSDLKLGLEERCTLVANAINDYTTLTDLMGLDSDEFIFLIGLHYNVKTHFDDLSGEYDLEPFYKVCNELMDEFLKSLLTI